MHFPCNSNFHVRFNCFLYIKDLAWNISMVMFLYFFTLYSLNRKFYKKCKLKSNFKILLFVIRLFTTFLIFIIAHRRWNNIYNLNKIYARIIPCNSFVYIKYFQFYFAFISFIIRKKQCLGIRSVC